MSGFLHAHSDAFAQATAVLRRGRPLDRARLLFHFESGPAELVVSALEAFQNRDGGFHGLEPDVGIPASSVLCTCRALHTLHAVGAGAKDAIVQRALTYLLASHDPSLEAWPIIPPHDNSAPHAPWWTYSGKFADNFGRYQDNPRPDVLACLYLFAHARTDSLRRHATDAVLKRLRTGSPDVEMHGLLCFLRLHEAPGIPEELERELDRILPGWIEKHVQRDPAKWTGYGLRPLDIAPTTASVFCEQLGPSLDENLDFLVNSRDEDGGWQPTWNWGGTFPEAWPVAKRDWEAELTLQALLSLQSHGRIAR